MEITFKNKTGTRAISLNVFLLAMLFWNMGQSSIRDNLGGKFYQVFKEEVTIRINAPGKIEPLIQKIIRSELDGRKLAFLARVGDTVKQGQLLMKISDEKIRSELVQKKNALRNARTDMQKAKRDYQLEKSLFKQQAVPKRDVENAKQVYERAVQSWNVAKDDLADTEKRAKGVNVKSPIDGVLIKNYMEKQEWISSGQELLTVARLEDFAVRGKVDELDIAKVKEGQEAIITMDAFPGHEIPGQVSWIGVQADEGAFAQIDVLINILDKKELSLKPNLSADSAIITGTIPEGIILPTRAIRSGPNGAFVLLKRPGGWLVEQPVSVSHISSGEAIIDGGLKSGQSILIPEED